MFYRILKISLRSLSLLFFIYCNSSNAQQSIARQWNEEVLHAIRKDFARPTVHARNLFHTSVAMYDAWAAFEPTADTYFLGKTIHGYSVPFIQGALPANVKATQEEAMSFAVYRLIRHRFKSAPGRDEIFASCDKLMKKLGYDIYNSSSDYYCGAAELGNYIAEQLILYGFEDGSNEQMGYSNQFYRTVNPALKVDSAGNPTLLDMNRWQPLELGQFIDQSGNPVGGSIPAFLGAEWGFVKPFSLNEDSVSYVTRDGHTFPIYHNPGTPPHIEDSSATGVGNLYKWAFSLVSVWSSHLNPSDTTHLDISPASMGNIPYYPSNFSDFPTFYNLHEGGDIGAGHLLNPSTGKEYTTNRVLRSDYTRVLAEFWADGPNSETPPGHWFTILNSVNDHPALEKKFMGQGPILDDLEWDVKSYFILGGAMHDAAITAWGVKGYYDFIRPVSAIRGMAEYGQSTDSTLSNYHKFGLPLIPGFIEIIQAGDSLQGDNGEYIGDIKLYAWRGPDYIDTPATDISGVGWIRAANWWPYQRPSFVTPPFAGYVSGHSTFSRAAAEVIGAFTGDAYFPGGMGEFHCTKNEFLVFEDGPSQDITLQWATYRDAADQCSLSRIWGGIHPPIDDLPGRLMGKKIGLDAFSYALPYFYNSVSDFELLTPQVFPNPTSCGVFIDYSSTNTLPVQVFATDGKLVAESSISPGQTYTYIDLCSLKNGVYFIVVKNASNEPIIKTKILKN